ncbi:MAG: hypothetical protein GWO02_17480 [Gammaproteobacteria bacterium]|nr:hypothetical protein [Gammaproteobacteria bacterium]
MAGRAGRGEQPGDVYIQTLCPDHYAIARAAAQDYGAFFEREAELRRSLAYPPFARLLGITGMAANRPRLSQTMQRLAGRLRGSWSQQGVKVLGPAVSPIPRIRGRFREQILLKGGLAAPEAKRALLEAVADCGRAAPGVDFQVDVDPVNML